MKTIVTHMAPDVDATSSVWLLKRFLPGWEDADVAFVPAGQTLNKETPDIYPDILHVDTGMGMLDHHQTDEYTCAAKRTWEYIKHHGNVRTKNAKFVEALDRLTDVVNDIDHFKEAYYPDAIADHHDFSMVAILDGWKLIYNNDNQKIVDLSMEILDGILRTFQNKVWAETEIRDKGVDFETVWGKGIGIETINDEVVRIAQRQGYIVALRKDPKKGFVRLKGLPDSRVDLTIVYNKMRELDPEATWFLHASKKMLLNGSIKNPDSRPSKLSMKEIIEVLKNLT